MGLTKTLTKYNKTPSARLDDKAQFTFENVTDFKYVVSLVRETAELYRETNARINTGNRVVPFT